MEHVSSPTNATPVKAPLDVIARYEAARAECDSYDALDRSLPRRVVQRYRAAERAVIAKGEMSLTLLKTRVAAFAMQMDAVDVRDAVEVEETKAAPEASTRLLVQLYEHLAEIEHTPLDKISPFNWLKLSLLAEGLAKACAAEQWPNYAINPGAIAHLAGMLANIHQPVRDLCSEHCQPASTAALTEVWFKNGAITGGKAGATSDFDEGAWIDSFERPPGHSVSGNGPTSIDPDAWPDGEATRPLPRNGNEVLLAAE